MLPSLPAPAPESILTIEEICERFHVEQSIVRSWMTSGPAHKRLGHFRRGRVVVTTEALLAQWFAKHLVNPPPAAPRTSTLETNVLTRAYWMVGELVKVGRLRVEPPPKENAASSGERTAEERSTPVEEANHHG